MVLHFTIQILGYKPLEFFKIAQINLFYAFAFPADEMMMMLAWYPAKEVIQLPVFVLNLDKNSYIFQFF